jgi:hypothetical protein
MNALDLKQLLIIIEQQLDWGESTTWQSKDFENLNDLILEKTKVSLSASTLRRLWGRVKYNHLPSATTLDTLARFAGFENWRAYTQQGKVSEIVPKTVEVLTDKTKIKSGWWLIIAFIIISVVTISLASKYVKKSSIPVITTAAYSFSSRSVTRSIPNSVVFNYNAKAAPTDSVFIQQSWDDSRRTEVSKNFHQHTSVYYMPGFYKAKLVVNQTVVKECPLLIPTNDWLGLIAQQPIPVYLKKEEFISKDGIELPLSSIQKKNISVTPQPPIIEFYNVGNFKPVPLKDFSYSVMVKNNYHEGAAACQFINIILITDDVPIIIPLSALGCVSELNLLDGYTMVSGKNTDLSGFGTDLSKWVKVFCRSTPSKIEYYLNDKLVYTSLLSKKEVSIVGIGYFFQGTGSIKKIELRSDDKIIFNAF